MVLHLSPVQTFITQKTSAYIASKLGTTVDIKKVNIYFFDRLQLEGLKLLDQQQDTLLWAQSIDLTFNNFFFLKEQIIVKDVVLNNTKIQLHRSAKTGDWNYQYIIEKFGNNDSTTAQNATNPNIQIQNIQLNAVDFAYIDAWVGTDYYVKINEFDLKGDDIDYQNKIIKLSRITSNDFTLGIKEYTGGRPPRKRKPINHSLHNKTPFNPELWQVFIEDIDIKASRFFLEYPETPVPQDFFSELHLDITHIATKIKNVVIQGDTIKGQVQHLKAQERSGLAIQEFRADVTVSPNISECKNLYLRTNNSEIRDYYAMRYRHFPDFLNYIENVEMIGNFKDAKIGIADISYFTDALERIKPYTFQLKAKARGTVANLSAQQVSLNDDNNTFEGNFSIKNIPNVSQIALDINKGSITGQAASLLKYFPELQQHPYLDVAALGNYNIRGNFNGILDNFSTSIEAQTALGNAQADFIIKDATKKLLSYKGTINTQQLDIGALTKQSDWGPLSITANIDGKGLDLSNSQYAFQAQIDKVQYLGYDYKQISLDGTYNNDAFMGKAIAQDSNLDMAIYNGKIYFENNKTHYSLDAKINHINTKNLNWTTHPLTGSAEVNMNFTGNKLDNFLGSLLFYNMSMKVDNSPLKLSQFYLSSTLSQDKKNISFVTNGIDANIFGDFTISTLSTDVQAYLSQYFPEYFQNKKTTTTGIQDFSFSIATKESDDFFRMMNIPVKLQSGALIKGHFNNINDKLSLNGQLPYLSIGAFNFTNTNFTVAGDKESVRQELALERFNFQDYEIASILKLNTEIVDNLGEFQLKTESVNTLGNAEIAGKIRAVSDSFYLDLAPSNLFFNHKKWEIISPKTIVFGNNFLLLPYIQLLSGKQQIHVNQFQNKANDIAIELKNVEANPLNNLFKFTNGYISGKVDGDLYLTDVFTKQEIDYAVYVDTLSIDDIQYGQLHLLGKVNLKTETLNIAPPSRLTSAIAQLDFKLKASYSEQNPFMEGHINIDEMPLNWLHPFLKDYVSNLKGSISAQLQLGGTLLSPSYKGNIALKEIAVTPIITNVPYYIDNHKFSVNENAIIVKDVAIRDALYNKGLLNGTIYYEGWQDYFFNLALQSDKLQILNLTKQDNDYFYGNIFAKTDVKLSGHIEQLRFNVMGKPLAGSKLFIPITSGGDYSQHEYITFKKNTTVKKNTSTGRVYNYNLKIDAIATPDLEAFIILDESTGDIIQAKGNGNITMEIPSNGAITLNGNYIIEEGAYNFAFKQMEVFNLKKRFLLESGSIIKWNGDLYDADLDVRANTQVKARLFDLISNEMERISITQQEISDAQLPQPINIHLNMNGALSKPMLSFQLEVVENRSVGTYAYQKLQRINTNEREQLNQVAGLLILNQFLPSEGAANSSISAGAITNMSEVLSATASSQISNFANKLLGWEDLFINFKYKNYALSGIDPNNPAAYTNRNEAGLNVRKNFFDNRLVTEVGGIYDWGNNTTNYNLAGEFKLQYLLTKDGRIRLNAYRTSSYDAVFQQNVGRQGAGLLFKRSFSSWKSLFQNNNSSNSKTFKPSTTETLKPQTNEAL